MSASKRLGAVATHLAAATQQEIEETAAWTLGIYGNRPVSSLKAYDYSPSDYAGFPDVTVTLARKKLLVEPIPADWKPEDGDTASRLPVYQITFTNPSGADLAGNTDFESIGFAMDRGDAVKFRFRVGHADADAKAFSVCREAPGEFDICAKIYPHGMASGHLFNMSVGDTIGCFVHRKGKRVSRERRPGSHVALVAYGVGITEILPMAMCELQQPEPESVRVLWASRTKGDCSFWRDQLEAMRAMHPDRFSFVEIFSRDPAHAESVGALQGRVDAAVCRDVFDQYWGTYVGGPNEAARPGVRFQNVAEKELLKEADKMWGAVLGYPKKTQRLMLDKEDPNAKDED